MEESVLNLSSGLQWLWYHPVLSRLRDRPGPSGSLLHLLCPRL